MITINDFLNNLSNKEKELHKDLITECLEREKLLTENGKQLLDSSEKYQNALNSFSNSSENINKLAKDLKEVVNQANDSMMKSMLSMLPKENFFEA